MTDGIDIFGGSFEDTLNKLDKTFKSSSNLFLQGIDQKEQEIDQQILEASTIEDSFKAKWLNKSLQIDKDYCQKVREVEQNAEKVMLEDTRLRMKNIYNS